MSGCVAPNVGSLRGRLTLRFTATGAHTILSHANVVAPLKIVRPFRLDDGRLLVQMLSLGPGLCGGDACSIDVTVEQGARVVLVAQSATRILAMRDSEPARQRVTLTVRAGGQLEYYPGLVIPFPDSSVEQRLDVDLEPGARVGVVESFAMGRTGRGEYLQFRRLLTRTAVATFGAPLYRDGMDLQPGAANLAGTGVLEGYRYVASGYWYGASDISVPPRPDERLGVRDISVPPRPDEGLGIRDISVPPRPDEGLGVRDISVPPRPDDDSVDGVLMAIGQPAANQIYLRVLAADGCRLGESLQKALRGIQAGWGLTPIPLQRFTS